MTLRREPAKKRGYINTTSKESNMTQIEIGEARRLERLEIANYLKRFCELKKIHDVSSHIGAYETVLSELDTIITQAEKTE